MAASASVLEDGSLLSRLDRTLYSIEGVLALLCGLAVFSLMFLAVYSVGGRYWFNSPMPGYVDWIEQLMPMIAFLAISYTQRDGGHIRMDILVGRLKGRALWCAEFITVLSMLVLMLFLVWGSWSHFGRAFDWNAPLWSRDSSIDIALPLWPAKLLVPFAFSVISLRLTLQLWAYGRAILSGAERPSAVPLIKDAAQMAADEAETVSEFDR